MVIQHNIPAINSYRNLGINQSSLNKNLEKLSSGYKINRAGDDAAGLAISESMRSQINGLNQAASNANDAVGLIQTAEGALTEIHSMLQRMTTLATQAANGTYNSVARGNIQEEIDALVQEIDRVANYTDFNGVKPLANTATKGSVVSAGGNMTFQIGPTAAETIRVSGQALTMAGIFSKVSKSFPEALLFTDKDGKTIANANASSLKATTSKKATADNLLYIGKKTTTYANRAVSFVKAAIDVVSTYRAKLGAAQNRLEHTIASLKVTSENISAAESRIRDTDMADEITSYTKNNILLQAAQSMLSQANAAPQGVLSLLQ